MDKNQAVKQVMKAMEELSYFHRTFQGYDIVHVDKTITHKDWNISKLTLLDLDNFVGLARCILDDNLAGALARVCELDTNIRDYLSHELLEYVGYV